MSVVIYTTKVCPFCIRAKSLLLEKGVNFEEIDISSSDTARNEMIKKSNNRTSVPQIFINEKHIGGCDDLYGLEEQGELDTLLKKA